MKKTFALVALQGAFSGSPGPGHSPQNATRRADKERRRAEENSKRQARLYEANPNAGPEMLRAGRGFAPFTPTRGYRPWTPQTRGHHPANLIVANPQI